MKNSDSNKDKKSKRRLLSPSFKKGVVNEKKEIQDEFQLNLVTIDDDDKPTSKKKSSKEINKISHLSSNDMGQHFEVEVFQNGHINHVASHSQAGKGEGGFVKVNQDSFLVIQNEYNLVDFNIFAVLDGHGENGHLISRFITKYFATFLKKNKKMKALKNESEVYFQ